LGYDEVPSQASLTDQEYGDRVKVEKWYYHQIHHSDSAGIPNPLLHSGGELPTVLNDAFTWPFRNIVTLDNMQAGERVIIRASLRLEVPDMGARTYYNGQPATIRIGLMRHEGDTGDITSIPPMLSEVIPLTMIRQTEQRFRFAFTDKVPSASSLSHEALADAKYLHDPDGDWSWESIPGNSFHHARDSNLSTSKLRGLWYRDNRGPSDKDKNPSDSVANHHPVTANTMNYPSQFNYTVAHLYEHSGTSDVKVSFILCCYISGLDTGMDFPDGYTPGGQKGCGPPLRLPVVFADYTMTTHPVRR
jgi:hypothetical protein